MSELCFNRVLLTGTLVDGPELRESVLPGAVCFLRVRCVSCQLVAGVEEERVNVLGVLVVGPHAGEVRSCLRVECRVSVAGWLESAFWEDGGGPEREGLSVIAERVQLSLGAVVLVVVAGYIGWRRWRKSRRAQRLMFFMNSKYQEPHLKPK